MDNSISIGDLAAILTALGVSIYVVGLLGLAITIRLKLASTTSIAWYAVSLLPKTVVAGHGVRIWLGWPIVLTFVLLPAAYWAGSRSWHGPNGRDPLILVTSAVLFTVLIVTVVILVRVARSQGGWLFPVMERIDDQSVVRLGVLALSIGTLIMVTIGSSTMIFAALLIAQSITSDTILNVLTTVPAESRLVVGIMILLVGGFFVGVPAALTVEPPLPHVKVAKNNGQGATWGRLVIHSEGFWYLFVGPNRNTVLGLLDWSYELLSIPDAEVLTVQTVGKVDKYIAGELEHD